MHRQYFKVLTQNPEYVMIELILVILHVVNGS